MATLRTFAVIRRLTMLAALVVLPVALTGCPDDDTSVEEGVEEVQDEIDDAL